MMTPPKQDQQQEEAVFKVKFPPIPSPWIKNSEYHLHKNKISFTNQTFKLNKVYKTVNKIQIDHVNQNSSHQK